MLHEDAQGTTYDINDACETKSNVDCQKLGLVVNRPYQLVVALLQLVIVQFLRRRLGT